MATGSPQGPPEDDQTLGPLLRAWRERKLLTQEQLAERAGLNVRTVRRLERGTAARPRSASVRLLADALGLSVEERAALIATTRERAADDAPDTDGPGPGPATSIWHQTATAAHRHLPADVAAFVGRVHELAKLDSLPDLDEVVVTAIDGMPGVGKTALAVHAAHQLAPQYPDGQLFIDLHGYSRGTDPITPGDALDRILRALGVPSERIPQHVDDRAALYRSRLAGKRMLIVLDNATNYGQIEPLIPGTPGCPVLVTSRRRLTGLDPTRAVSLDVLPLADAVSLFARTAGADRVAGAAPEVLDELAGLCGQLPLALRIAAARLRAHPAWTLPHLVARLREQEYPLAELEAGQRSVAAALELSYRELAGELRRAFRLLSLHPGADVDHYAAAAMLDTTPTAARRILDELFEAHLLDEPAPGRYRFHDLTLAHAAEAATRDETEPDRRAALSRLFDHYCHAATISMDLADPDKRDVRPRSPFGGGPMPPLDYADQAAEWLEAELSNLLATARHATDGWPAHTRHLSATLHRHLRGRGQYADAEALHLQALTAARATGDRAGQMGALNDLGHIHRRQGRAKETADAFAQALEIARATGDPTGQVIALNGLGWLHLRQGRHDEAADEFEQALDVVRADQTAADTSQQLGDLSLIAHHWTTELNAMVGLGATRRLQGRHEEAADGYQRVLDLARTAGHQIAELNAMVGLGDIHRLCGRLDEAADSYQQVLDLAEQIGDRNWRFEAAQALGRLHHAAGHPDQALTRHRQALDVAADLGQLEDQARAQDGIAHAHNALNQHEQAHRHWQHALDILTRLGIGHTEDKEATAAGEGVGRASIGQGKHASWAILDASKGF